MKNIIFNEDCLYTLTERKLNYDYVICSPPDYDELGMKPIKDDEKYFSWLGNIFSKLKPNNNTITIVVSNRRYNRITIPKHHYITSIMKDLGYDLLNEKIWKKSNEINSYIKSIDVNYDLAEQYNPVKKKKLSAKKLTWNYAELYFSLN